MTDVIINNIKSNKKETLNTKINVEIKCWRITQIVSVDQ